MGKIRKFAEVKIRKIIGGRDPLRVVEEFLLSKGFDPDKCKKKEGPPDLARWLVPLKDESELEILVEGIKNSASTTIYMGVNIVVIPLRGLQDLLVAALEIADGLVGIKVSLVGHYLVLSASLVASDAGVDDLEYYFNLIESQQAWFRDTLAAELGWVEAPDRA
jgi:hypothetical protein